MSLTGSHGKDTVFEHYVPTPLCRAVGMCQQCRGEPQTDRIEPPGVKPQANGAPPPNLGEINLDTFPKWKATRAKDQTVHICSLRQINRETFRKRKLEELLRRS